MENAVNARKYLVGFLFMCVVFAMCFPWTGSEVSAAAKVEVDSEASLRSAIDQAKEETTIQINGLIEIDNTITVPANAQITFVSGNDSVNGIKAANGMSASKSLLEIANAASVTMDAAGNSDGLIIDGNSRTGVPIVDCKGDLTFNKGKITGSAGTTDPSYGGGVMISGMGKFQMNGGEISGNKAFFKSHPSDSRDQYGGGGVYIGKNANFIMTGGVITKNEGYTGSGVHVADGGIFVMKGGTITENACREEESQGGGVYSNSNGVEIEAGTISKNRANLGGGIYIHDNKDIGLRNILISNNGSIDEGGGVWLCPLGGAEINVTEGVAIVPNKSDTTGDDFFSRMKANSSDVTLELSGRILGGGPVTWYEDDEGSRYNDGTRNQVTSGRLPLNKDMGFHAVASDADIQAAQNQAKVKVIDNYADWVGGGIAANGMVVFGEPDKDVSCKAIKKWDDNDNEANIRPDAVKVQLYQNGKALGAPVELNESNGWEYEFKDLPAYIITDKGLEECKYTVKELAVDGYKAGYDSKWDEKNRQLTITITNKFSEDVDEETEPTRDEPTSGSGADENDGSGVRTGDNSNLILFIVLAVISGCAVLWLKKKGFKLN